MEGIVVMHFTDEKNIKALCTTIQSRCKLHNMGLTVKDMWLREVQFS